MWQLPSTKADAVIISNKLEMLRTISLTEKKIYLVKTLAATLHKLTVFIYLIVISLGTFQYTLRRCIS